MRRSKSDFDGRVYRHTRKGMVYAFCSMECSTNFRSGKPRAEAADDEVYGCFQCGRNLVPDLGSVPSSGPADSLYQNRRRERR